jgi:hypothetical protein
MCQIVLLVLRIQLLHFIILDFYYLERKAQSTSVVIHCINESLPIT